jgi:hypothetical protein
MGWNCSCIEKWSFSSLQRLRPVLRIAVFAFIASFGFGAMTTHAAPLTFGTTNVALTSPSTTLTIASGSTADSFTVNATSVVVSLSATGGNSFILTSPDYDLSVATSGSAPAAPLLTCVGGQGEAGTASVTLKQTSGSATYTIAPTGSACTVPLVTTGGIIIYPIMIHAPSYASTTVGDTLVIPVSATDPNGYPTTISARLPPDATFSTSTNNFVWSPQDVGVASATILATDKVTQTTSTITLEAFSPIGTSGAPATSTIAATSSPSIDALKAEIATLEQEVQQLIAELKSRGLTPVTQSSGYVFERNLTVGSRGDDVHTLQLFLVQENTGPAARALKTHGTTHYFGPLTRAALAEYQKKAGITPAVGYFGPITRKYINSP